MKLKNKLTGEIIEAVIVDHGAEWEIRNVYTNEDTQIYNSLAELNAEWEDVPEEPKKYWCISENGVVGKRPYTIGIECVEQENRDEMREIGNYFETKEEAEKAVEKLKAWKRLKDKGYRVMMNNHVDGMLYLRIWNDTTDAPTPINKAGEIYKDLDLLFGGEE